MKFKPTKEQQRIFHFIVKRPENVLIKAYAGCGKCLGKDTPVLMFDGTIKMVQDVNINDLLMGDDSTPRKVLNTSNGHGDLYKIIPQKGDSWICNDVHMLTHYHEYKKKLLDTPLNEINYPKYPNGNYRYAQLQRTGVVFKENSDIIDPYLLGLWLGDGSKTDGNPKFTINENETNILHYLLNVQYDSIIPKQNKYDGDNGCYTILLTTENFNGRTIKNVLRDEFRLCYNNDNSIFIPEKYLINSTENRKRLLAGLLDSDGHNNNKYFEIVTKYDSLAENILFLCRSLGLAAYKSQKIGKIKSLNFEGVYWRVSISGTFEDIPFLGRKHNIEKRKQIKSVLRTGFKKEYIGKGDYYGFTLDGNGRFLLGDFTITHNTTTIVEAVKLISKDKSIMFLAFNRHIKEELEIKLPEHVRCYTTYGLGNAAIKRKYGNGIEFDEFKIDKIILKKSKSWSLDEEFDDDNEINIYLTNIKKLVNFCRLSLTLKPEFIPYIAERYEIPLTKTKDIKRVLKVLDTATNDRKSYDYTDMVYLPAVDNSIWMFPQDYVFVDECLPAQTYISTTKGKFKIKTLCEKYEKTGELPIVTTFNEKLKIFEEKQVNNIWCNGEKDVYYVILNGKRKLKSTVNHRFLTNTGWKRLDELKINDIILSNYNKQPYHQTLNDTQKNIVIGSKLGDGCLTKISDNIFRLKINHGENQKEYIQWKSGFFNEKVNTVKKNGFANKIAYSFTTKSFYFNLSDEEIINNISLQSLAISWMDDGSISDNYLESRLYSTAKSFEFSQLLSNKIYEKWGVVSSIRNAKSSTTKRDYYWLSFNKANTQKISKLLSPYIHRSMEYKLCPEDRGCFNQAYWSSEKNNMGCMVVTKEYSFYKREKTYDMEVEDNHNFIITSTSKIKTNAENYGIIAHNCQDLNRCQIRIIEKILKKDKTNGKTIGRLIGVGDFFQGIYGFNATDEKSFEWFEKFQNTKTLPLSTSFRCSKAVIRKAQEIVPEINALEDAPEGMVRDGSALNEAKSGDFILCRTTMPLVQMFFEFLKQNKKAIIKGSDIGIHLIELIGKINSIEKLITFWESELAMFRRELKNEGVLNPNDHTGYSALEDKVLTLLFLARISESIADLKNKISVIFTDSIEGICLSTVHKVKGLEADRVFIIRPDLLPMKVYKPWQVIQEKNLEYVAITRSRLELIYDREWTNE